MAVDWIKVFSSDEEARARILPDRPQLLILSGKRICLALHENEFFAVQDACSHNGESLSKGRVNFLGEIVCPWHGYRFNLQSGRATDSSSSDLTTFPVKVDSTGFYIGVIVEKA
jgi:3-phenylpropionate/trans-cinnamate dioxygenase ferredoxin subunit